MPTLPSRPTPAAARRLLPLAVSAGLLGACAPPPAPAPEGPAARPSVAPVAADTLRADVVVRPLAAGVWLHTTTKDGIPSNGLLVETPRGTLLVDTAWDDEQTALLLDWAAARLRPVHRAVITHHHEDRMGGLATLRARGIPAGASDLTVAAARAKGLAPPDVLFAASDGVFREAAEGFEVFHPGPGHTTDNVVVWVPAARVLFGGCFVRAGETRGLGNVADADRAAWPASAARLGERYGAAARIVVPGHGAPGDASLFEHTRALAAAGR